MISLLVTVASLKTKCQQEKTQIERHNEYELAVYICISIPGAIWTVSGCAPLNTCAINCVIETRFPTNENYITIHDMRAIHDMRGDQSWVTVDHKQRTRACKYKNTVNTNTGKDR